MTDLDPGHLSATGADVYESHFVPALFAQWTDVVLDAAGVVDGDRVLDVGCGTGVLARRALGRVGEHGTVVGVDPNEGMLSVARRSAAGVAWRSGGAEALPFEDGTFDRVVSQFALMFFSDRAAGVGEMVRVARPGAGVAVAVWASLDRNPGYAALTALVERLFGPTAADAIRAPFAFGDHGELWSLLGASLSDPALTEHPGVARFDSLASWLHTEIRGWTLADLVDDEGFQRLLHHAERELDQFVDAGAVALPVTAVVARADVKRR